MYSNLFSIVFILENVSTINYYHLFISQHKKLKFLLVELSENQAQMQLRCKKQKKILILILSG